MYPVLIVEDEAAIADLIEDTLVRLDYPCVKAFDGEEAATCIEEQTFDLILLDVMLPGIDGFGLMDYIRPTGTPVIFLTARASVEDRVRGLKAGAYDYIVKPFAPEELLARVDGLMRHMGRRSRSLTVWGSGDPPRPAHRQPGREAHRPDAPGVRPAHDAGDQPGDGPLPGHPV